MCGFLISPSPSQNQLRLSCSRVLIAVVVLPQVIIAQDKILASDSANPYRLNSLVLLR